MLQNCDNISCNTVSTIGIGLTSRCNLNCPHCYSRQISQKDLSKENVKEILRAFPNLKKVNFGTGESILNKDFFSIVDLFLQRNIQMALTSNGLTLNMLSGDQLKSFTDIDISIDFPNAKEHDQWRGTKNLFSQAIKGVETCRKLGINTSIATCLMNINYKSIVGFKSLLDKYNICLRINLYKPVNSNKFLLSYNQFWEAIKIISENFQLVKNSEPILSIITHEEGDGSPCGNSLRIHPDLTITPCVYLEGDKVSYGEFLKNKDNIPKECSNCRFVKSCRGGCLGRRYLTAGVAKPDIYCPIVRGETFPKITFSKINEAEEKDFIHGGYLCTLILR